MARTPRPSRLSPLALARRNAIYKGLLGGDRRWLALGGAAWALRVAKKSFGKTEQIVATETLQPGEWLSLRTIVPTSRRQERRNEREATRAEKLAARAEKLAAQAEKLATRDRKRAAAAATARMR